MENEQQEKKLRKYKEILLLPTKKKNMENGKAKALT